ncbi:MAG: hypothetical protein WC479_07760 [Candidatus Izemoplasmatales bacterium]
MIVIVARDFRDLKYIIRKQYREAKSVFIPKSDSNVLTPTPESVSKAEEDERNKLWYGN